MAAEWRIARGIAGALACFALGCGTHLRLLPAALPAPEAHAAPAGLPLLVELVEARRNGLPELIDDSLANRVAMDFRQTGAFPYVLEPVDAHRAPRDALRALLLLEETEDPHSVANGFKAFATGISLFLLTPMFFYDYDTELSAEATLRTCDGWSKRYMSRASGSLRNGLFHGEERSPNALRAGVMERALTPLVAEVARDAELHARAAAARPGCGAGAR